MGVRALCWPSRQINVRPLMSQYRLRKCPVLVGFVVDILAVESSSDAGQVKSQKMRSATVLVAAGKWPLILLSAAARFGPPSISSFDL